MAQINVLCGDRGGLEATLAALRPAVRQFYDCRIYLTATSGHQYVDGTPLNLDTYLRADTIAGPTDYRRMEAHFGRKLGVVIIGASQSAAGAHAEQAAISLAINYGLPAAIIEDMYGSAIPILTLAQRDQNLSAVELVCVSDRFAQTNIVRHFPELTGKVIITGAPQFDHIGELRQDWPKKRLRLRALMGLADNEFLFLFAGQLSGSYEALMIIYEAAKCLDIRDRLRILFALHARASEQERQEIENCALPRIIRREDITIYGVSQLEDFLPAADFVGSGYSTINRWGILCEMPGVIYFGTPKLKEDLQREKGLEKPIEVTEYGAASYAVNVVALKLALEDVVFHSTGRISQDIATAQRTIAAAHDGHSAERVWAEIEKLL